MRRKGLLNIHSYVYIRTYRKRQKSSERKVLRFNGFHSNVGKTFAVCFICIESAEESHCSRDSSGKLSCFIENPQKP